MGPWSGSLRGGYTSGTGPYKVRRNSLANSLSYTGGVPRVRNRQRGEAFVISHREYVGEITSGTYDAGGTATRFKLESHRLNPANQTLFPWLSAFAGAFQEWELNGCLIQLRTESSDIAPAVTLGMYGLAAEYNVLADEPVSKLEVENMENAGTSKISVDLVMPIECDRKQTSISHLFVGPIGGAMLEGDLRLYDICKFYVFSQGIPKENVKVAELWVTYEVAFYKPTITPLIHSQDSYSWYARFYDCDLSIPFGTSRREGKFNSPTITFNEGPAEFHLPPANGQCFLVWIKWLESGTGSYLMYKGVECVPDLSPGVFATHVFADDSSSSILTRKNLAPNPDPSFSSGLTVTTSGLLFILKLVDPAEPGVDWDPRFSIVTALDSLPEPDVPSGNKPLVCEVIINIFNSSFFEQDEGTSEWRLPWRSIDEPAPRRTLQHRIPADPRQIDFRRRASEGRLVSPEFAPPEAFVAMSPAARTRNYRDSGSFEEGRVGPLPSSGKS